MLNSKLSLRIFIGVLIFGFVFRLHGFSNPIADWHSWRQADTSAVSRNFVRDGFDVLHPRFDDLSNVPSKLDNPEGYRFVEFPFYNVVQAGLYMLVGIFSLEQWGRLITIAMSLLSSVFLYKIVSKYSGEVAGLATGFFYTFLPYNIYYGQVILPDPSMVAALLGALYLFDKWLGDKRERLLLFLGSGLLMMVAVLLKPYALFFAPVFFILSYNKYGFELFKKIHLWLYAALIFVPFICWRLWMSQFPEGIPQNTWLLNGNGIRFRPAFFRWMVYERLIKLISGYVGIVILFIGLYELRYEKAKLLYLSFIVSCLAYVIIFATGNVHHDYYQIVIMPVIAILFGLSAKYFFNSKKITHSALKALVFILLVAGSFYFSWMMVRDYFNINNHSIVLAGQAVDQLTPSDAKVIAVYGGDTSFLYQTKRKGWALLEKSIPEMVTMGADYLVIANPSASDELLGKEYLVVKQVKEFIILDITKRP